MNAKVARDPFLHEVCRRWGLGAADEAGFFHDADPDDAPLDDVTWLCTPTEVVRRALRETADASGEAGRTGPPVVLLSTGGFFPVHRGHLEMMAQARAAATAAGWRVVGGYLSPAHDDYIRLKCGSVPIGVSERLAGAETTVAATGWLSVDPWEALARRVAVNYTDVTARLQAYLRAHLDPAIEVAYVGGGDNARFSLAFAARGRAIFVGRPGTEDEVTRWRGDPRVGTNPDILWAPGAIPLSSSGLRPAVWPRRRAAQVHLRLEDARAVQTVGLDSPTWRAFQAVVRRTLAAHAPVIAVPLEAHRVLAPATISLDPMVPGTIDLAVSRLFDLGGYRQLGHVGRPGTDAIEEQFARVPAGEWELWDDDRASGSTLAMVRRLLGDEVVLTGASFAVDAHDRVAPDDPGAPEVEIADSRDFLLGSDHGGLVVALPDGTAGRAPYLLPYVDPAVRCGLPAGVARAFSQTLWEANAAVYARTTGCVRDLPPPAAATMVHAGHAPDALLSDVCRAHAAVLAGLAPLPVSASSLSPSPPAGAPAGSHPARA